MESVNLINVIDNYPTLSKIKNLINKDLPAKNGKYELATMREIIQNDYLLNIIRKEFKTKLGVRNTETGEIIIELDEDYVQITNGMTLKTFIYKDNNVFKVSINIENFGVNTDKNFILTPDNVLIVNERSFIYKLLKNRFMKTTDYEQNLSLYKIDVIQKSPTTVYQIPELSNLLLQPENKITDQLNVLTTLLKSRPQVKNIIAVHNTIEFDLFNVGISVKIIKEKDDLFTLNLTMHDFYHIDTNDKSFKTIDEMYDFINGLISFYNNYNQAENDLINFVK